MEPGERGDCDLGVPYEMAAATAGEEVRARAPRGAS